MQSRHAQCAVAATALSQAGKAARGEGRRRRERGSKQRQLRHTSDCSNHSSFIILSADLLPRPASTALLLPFPTSLSFPLPALTDPQLIFISLYFVAFVFVLLPNANCPAAYHASLMPAASRSALPSLSPTPALSSLPLPIPSHWPARALPLPTATNRIWKCENAENCKMLTSLCPPPSLSNPLHQCAAPSLDVYRDYQLLIRMKMMRPTESRTRANGHVNGQRANWPTARAASPSTSLPLLSVSLSFPPIISYIDDQRHVLCAERSQSDKRQTSFAS